MKNSEICFLFEVCIQTANRKMLQKRTAGEEANVATYSKALHLMEKAKVLLESEGLMPPRPE